MVVYHDRRRKKRLRTICVIWEGDMRYVGISKCNEVDKFDKKQGREKAISRAKGAKHISKQTDTLFRFNVDYQFCPSKRIPKWMFLAKGQIEAANEEIPF